MAYGLIRVRNLSMGEVGGTEIHNFRQYEEKGIDRPENIDPTKDYFGNTHSKLIDANGEEVEASEGLTDAVREKLEALGITPRKNAVVALEYVVGASPDLFARDKGDYSPQTFLDQAAKWVAERHGLENVLSVSYHFDESNPHAHVVVLPITEKTVKWKNQNGSGERTEKRLCARDFTGGPKKLEALQDDYYQFCKGFDRKGVTFYRGTKAADQLKHYTKQTNHELGQIRAKISACEDLAKAKVMEKELEAKKADILANSTELQKRVEIKKEQNGKIDPKTGEKKWKKGKSFGLGF